VLAEFGAIGAVEGKNDQGVDGQAMFSIELGKVEKYALVEVGFADGLVLAGSPEDVRISCSESLIPSSHYHYIFSTTLRGCLKTLNMVW
jgi:hypothetical protein